MLAHIVMAVAWPVGALVTALKMQRELCREAKPAGLPVLMDMYWLALAHSIPPLEYKLYGFTDRARRALMHDYVYWNDLPALAALTRRLGADSRDVQDKSRFARLCAAHHLPHVETLAVYERGRQTFPADPFVPQSEYLWSKALSLKGGAGGKKWHLEANGVRDEAGRLLPLDAFRIELARQDTIVQPFLDNHPVIGRLSNGRLAVLRVVTGMSPTGEAEPVATVLFLPHGECTTTVGAIVCGLDRGLIGKAVSPGGETVDRHPDTAATIAGLAVPFFDESVALACRAHAQAFARFAFLGWDIALTASGPLLLETNAGWGALPHQLLDGPLGRTAFSHLVSQYV